MNKEKSEPKAQSTEAPEIEEIRRIKRSTAEEFDCNVDRLCEDLMRLQKKNALRLIRKGVKAAA